MPLADTSQTQFTARRRQQALAVFHGSNTQVREQGPGSQTVDQSTYQARLLGNMAYTTVSNGSGAAVTESGCGCTTETPPTPT